MTEWQHLGGVFGRPFPQRLPWWDADADHNADKWATAEETRSEILDQDPEEGQAPPEHPGLSPGAG
jgi:hypothetical protein